MEDSAKVFSSNITRVGSNHKNNLYDLLKIVPATPLKFNDAKIYNCDYIPKTGKFYIPKKKSRLKVKTVRDIRKAFEQDIYSYLKTDLEAQQNNLFKKIRRGSSRDDNTKKLASKILRGDTPISRSTWQMLINLNPEHHKYPRQFVLWNGKHIQVNGSYGGVNKKVCSYDLASKPQHLPTQNHIKQCFKQHRENKNKRLLRNSLAVTFKPGPLCKKQFLDNSHQKYHVGKIELVNLPKPGLEVQPTYGTAFDSSITNFLNNLREEDGTISQTWAELSVSPLGKIVKSKPVQLNRDYITFDLTYKYNRNRLLMRHDIDHCNTPGLIDTDTLFTKPRKVDINEHSYALLEIKDMLNKMLDAVEIHLIQDKLFIEEQELKTIPVEDLNSVNTTTHVKDKTKRKFGELDRLDVTVIKLLENKESNLTNNCSKMHCSYGCICESLKGSYHLNQHCGRVECMFDCKCNFLKFKNDLSYYGYGYGCTDIFSGLLSNDNKINCNLAKEEEKFHQTVVVSGEKRILLKGEKRNRKNSKNCPDFHKSVIVKNEDQKPLNLSIVAFKLNCENIETWCMVHKLYKCFCKGKFTDTCASVSQETGDKEQLSKDSSTDVDCLDKLNETNDIISTEECHRQEHSINNIISDNLNIKPKKIHTSKNFDKYGKRQRNLISVKDVLVSSEPDSINVNTEKVMLTRHAVKSLNTQNKKNSLESKSDSEDNNYCNIWESEDLPCSRTRKYEGRKYSDGYYKNTNYKITNMEKNDKRLQERLSLLYNKCCQEDTTIKPIKNLNNETAPPLKLLLDAQQNSDDQIPMSKRRRLDKKTSFVTWLETNYKLFRQQKNTAKNSLEPPKYGKVALHTWDFILKRYRERKNLFLVLRKPPFRIFMAINKANPIFENCIDINDIRFADLHKYPETVRNLLINATELKDNFCILRGLSFCWELIGSVSKVVEGSECTGQAGTPGIYMDVDTLSALNGNNSVIRNSVLENTEQKDMSIFDVFNEGDSEVLYFENTEHLETLNALDQHSELQDSLSENTETNSASNNSLLEIREQRDIHSFTEKDLESNTECSDDAGSSKWFVMTIENDFTEIRFFRKGFFVKYESIINAISVARLSGKTVRLSSKKCIEQPDAPQFGIYAIPNDSEYCVFVGPYEMEDSLGIETIKTILDVRRFKRTRGFWITTNKVDNLKVVENPLSFVPQANSGINSTLIPLEMNIFANDETNNDQQDKGMLGMQEGVHINKTVESNKYSPTKTGQIKIVKPIKIRKTNGFYHLASDGVLKKISLQCPQTTTTAMQVVSKPSINMEENSTKSLLKLKAISDDLNTDSEPPQCLFAEASSSSAVSQIKISSVFSTQNDDHIAKRTSLERGMFILKPEEINRKLVQNKLNKITSTSQNEDNINDGTNNPENITFQEDHSVNTEWSFSNDDIYVISDDENFESTNETINCNIWTDVWIECTNIPKLGWIAGIKNLDNLLSFKIPGCEYSEFYSEEEAYTNINIEIRKRINSLDNMELQWTVHESKDQLKGQEMDPEQLYPDYILPTEGLTHTSEIKKSNMDNLKTYSKKRQKGKGRETRIPHEIDKVGEENDKSSLIQEDDSSTK